jgi:hypothetical protein
MDIGRVSQETYPEDSHNDVEVGAVGGNTVCYTYGGWGHTARECPTQKQGKGKEELRKGLAAPKGWGKGKVREKGADSKDTGQGKGKGHQGTRLQCGNVGHKACERDPKHVGTVVETEELDEGEEQVDIGTAWNMVAVEKHVAHVGPTDVHSKGGKKGKAAEGEEKSRKNTEIALDSGVGASCWPESLLKETPMGPKVKGAKLKAANGSELKYHGTKKVRFWPKDGVKRGGGKVKEEDACETQPHVTDATKPLAAAVAVVRMRNGVALEEGPGRSYAENLRTDGRARLRESGGFAFDAIS